MLLACQRSRTFPYEFEGPGKSTTGLARARSFPWYSPTLKLRWNCRKCKRSAADDGPMAAGCIVLADIGMPDIDGYKFIRQVHARRRQSGVAVPAAALTAYSRTKTGCACSQKDIKCTCRSRFCRPNL
jgi:CheY-like chemotaxis protein